ncbi:MAG: hypothetical protein WDM87_00570 [Terracidiphilus sp.]
MSAVLGLLALLAPGALPIPAQASGSTSSAPVTENSSAAAQISSTPQGGFTLKANAELVLTT